MYQADEKKSLTRKEKTEAGTETGATVTMVHLTTVRKRIRKHLKTNSPFHLPPMNKVIVFCLLFFVTACQSNIAYHYYQPVAATGWTNSDTLHYTYTPTTLPTKQELEIGIRHLDSYPYRDLWLTISQHERIDTLHIYLANENGSWKGDGIGENRQYTEFLSQIDILPADSNLVFKIMHIMEDDTLKGIKDIGLCIKKKP